MEFAGKSTKRKDDENSASSPRRRGEDGDMADTVEAVEMDTQDGLVFEDPFGDEFEEEEYDEGRDEEEEGDAEDPTGVPSTAMVEVGQKQLWRPGQDPIGEGEELEYDPSAYIMYHSMRTEWPCLSFDFLRDDLGDNRQRFPLTMYVVTGSQADRADRNKITLLKLSDLHRTHVQQDSDEEDEEDDLDEDPTLEHANIPHQGGVNRIRSMPQSSGIVATLSDTRQAHIFDLTTTVQSMAVKGPRAQAPLKPAYSFKGHRDEGFALDWSRVTAGRLATGDCAGSIHVWNQAAGASAAAWAVDPAPFKGHAGSVEDIQWSPTEATVFASASADRTVKIWDTRGRTGPQISVDAHGEDVNVISWNPSVAYLLASGSDDGTFKVWDLRAIRDRRDPVANFSYHKGPVTSLEWAPHDESVLCVSSADNQVTIWDLSVEADEDAVAGAAIDPALAEYPAQLLFIHQGQNNVKEIHHHPQIPGVIMSTAEDGLNVFKPAITVQ